jgi:hypothetical protein
MLVTLAFFIAGTVLGSLHLPALYALGGIDPIVAGQFLGAWGGLAATLASVAAAAAVIAAIALRQGASAAPSRCCSRRSRSSSSRSSYSSPAATRGASPSGSPWGGKIATAMGVDLSGADFWQWPGPKRALAESVLTDTSSLTDFGMILGAMAATAASRRRFDDGPWPSRRSLAAAATGGLLIGWGARLGFGCNIGAFVGGVASGLLHGWVWLAAALAGSAPGIRLRPLFGLSREGGCDAPSSMRSFSLSGWRRPW